MMDLLNVDLNAVRNGKVKRSDKIEPLLGLNYRGVLDAATNVPVVGDVLSGGLAAYDLSQGDYGSAALNALGVLPFVSGTFIGKGAKTWDKVKEADAMSRLAKGEDAAKVWKDTGIGKAPWDKVARSEIPDNAAQMIDGKLPTQYIDGYGNVESWKLPNVFAHDPLYGAYPDLKNVSSSFFKGKPHQAEYSDMSGGWISYSDSFKKPFPSDAQIATYESAKNAIKKFDAQPHVMAFDKEFESIPTDAPNSVFDGVFAKHNGSQIEAERQRIVDEMLRANADIHNNPLGGYGLQTHGPAKSITLHELQHGIQSREGWAKGGTPDSAVASGLRGKDQQFDFARKAYEDAKGLNGTMSADALEAELLGKTYTPKYVKPWDDLSEREKLGWLEAGRDNAYRKLAGEAEARLTEYRMNLTPQERLQQYPYDPAYFKQATGVDINDLIVRGGDGPSLSVNTPKLTEFEQRHLIAQRNAALPVEQGGLGLPPNNTAMDRARAMGAEFGWAHGSPDPNITELRSSKIGAEGPGAYATNYLPEANTYAQSKNGVSLEGATVYPLAIMKDKSFNAGKANPYELLNANDDAELAQRLAAMGRDGIERVQEATPQWLIDAGGLAMPERAHYVSQNAANFRSPFAAFDPMRRHEADLLGYADPRLLGAIAGGGLLGLGGYSLLDQ